MLLSPRKFLTTHLEVFVASVAGVGTCVAARFGNVALAFDIGCCFELAVQASHVFITHGHVDHAGACGTHSGIRGLRKLPCANYYIIGQSAAALTTTLESLQQLDGERCGFDVTSVSPLNNIRITNKLHVTPFQTFHRVPSVGYVVYQKIQKLKPEYKGLSHKELQLLMRKGETIKEEVTQPVFAYTGDTTIEALLKHPPSLQATVLVMECTYIDDGTINKAKEFGHIHLNDIAAHASAFENQTIILMHFSARYDRRTIEKALGEKLPISLRSRVNFYFPH